MTAKQPEAPRNWQLLDAAPETTYHRLIIKNPFEDDRSFATYYAHAALRLAKTFKGQAADDMMLLPFLTLYRHAYELELKSCIQDWARWRRRLVSPHDEDLDSAAIQERLRSHHRHSLNSLLKEALLHFGCLDEAFDLKTEFPAHIVQIIGKLHQADKNGTNFRYTSPSHPNRVVRIDFPNLVGILSRGFSDLQAFEDYIAEAASGIEDWIEEVRNHGH